MTSPFRPLRPGTTAHGAFTLIEVLIAVAIFAVVLLAVQGIFHGALRLRNRTVESIEAARPLEQALAILRHDLANIVPPGGTLAGSLETSPILDGMNSQPSLQFNTSVGVLTDHAPWGEIHRVAYTLSASTNRSAGRELHRVVTRNLLPLTQDTSEDQPLLNGVESIEFSFHDGTSWRNTWDSTNEATLLPRAIRVELLMTSTNATQSRNRQPIELVVGIMVEPSTNTATQSESTGAGGGG